MDRTFFVRFRKMMWKCKKLKEKEEDALKKLHAKPGESDLLDQIDEDSPRYKKAMNQFVYGDSKAATKAAEQEDNNHKDESQPNSSNQKAKNDGNQGQNGKNQQSQPVVSAVWMPDQGGPIITNKIAKEMFNQESIKRAIQVPNIEKNELLS